MTLDAAKPKHRFVALDSLRGVCACMVLLVHCRTQGHFSELPVLRYGYLFVDFFFVLSGFVIGCSYGKRLQEGFSIGRFMWLRLWRVYPLHFFMLMLFFAFELAFAMHPQSGAREAFAGPYAPFRLIASLLMIQIFVGAQGWNLPSWSIAAEVWAYLIFALLLRFTGRWLPFLCVVIALGSLALIPQISEHYLFVDSLGALPRSLYGFSVGMLAWRLMPRVLAFRLAHPALDSALELLVVALVVAFVSNAGTGPLSMAAPAVFFVAVMTFARERGVVSSLLRTGPLVLIGTLSYSIYLIHWFLLWRFINGLSMLERLTGYDLVWSRGGANSIGGGPWFGDFATLIFLAIVIFCAYWTYRLIELPGQRFGRNWGVAREPREPVPAPGAP